MPSLIPWCDETINPQGWGCWGPGGTPEVPRRCWYCYVPRLVRWPGTKCDLCRQLIPHWHPERLEIPKRWRKPRRIFWGSTGDLFHAYTPTWQIEAVLEVVRATPQHIHIFLTKNPSRYQEFNPWPQNCWLLTTVTRQEDEWRLWEIVKAKAPVLGASIEPMLEDIYFISAYLNAGRNCTGTFWTKGGPSFLQWLIIGAMTGKGAARHWPTREMVQDLVDQGRAAGVPVFLKDNLVPVWGKDLIQEWPA